LLLVAAFSASNHSNSYKHLSLKSKDMYSDDNKANEIIRRFISYVDEATRTIMHGSKNTILLGLRSKRSKMPFFMLPVLVYGHKHHH
jgi:hypothetical protein